MVGRQIHQQSEQGCITPVERARHAVGEIAAQQMKQKTWQDVATGADAKQLEKQCTHPKREMRFVQPVFAV